MDAAFPDGGETDRQKDLADLRAELRGQGTAFARLAKERSEHVMWKSRCKDTI